MAEGAGPGLGGGASRLGAALGAANRDCAAPPGPGVSVAEGGAGRCAAPTGLPARGSGFDGSARGGAPGRTGGASAESTSAPSATSSTGGGGAVEPAMASALETWIKCPHLRHFIRTERPATFSSAIWYFALQLGQRNFIQPDAVEVEVEPFVDGEYREASIPTSLFSMTRQALDPAGPLARAAVRLKMLDATACAVRRQWSHPVGPSGRIHSSFSRCWRIDCRVASSGANGRARSHISTARFLNPAFW